MLPALWLPWMFASEPAYAEPHRVALVVGSNRPGPGQETLRFAGKDAERMRDVLVEVGGFAEADVTLLRDPSRASPEAALDELEAEVRRDEETLVFFYYSGHARAQGLDLGGDDVPLAALRARLEAIEATVALVVLDACQTGAFSEVKGVTPTAAFSFNSVDQLQAEGLAVLASSTGTELSQESHELEGSYFTHHLVSGLRGAADLDDDGAVTLAEAYGYARDRTLAATARTAVGEQHATLEMELRGRGELVLTRPMLAAARLELAAALDGELLLTRGGEVVAEIAKAKGSSVRLALPGGSYDGVLRREGRAFECAIELDDGETTAFDGEDCEEIAIEPTVAKGDGAFERFGFEGSLGPLWSQQDGYTDRLVDFGFDGPDSPLRGTLQGSVTYGLSRHFALAASIAYLDTAYWSRDRIADADDDGTADEESFGYTITRYGLYGRARLPLANDHLVPYAQVGLGPTQARTRWTTTGEDDEIERFLGYHLAMAAGGQWRMSRHFGLFAEGVLVYAPALPNLIGDRHDAGGPSFTVGARLGF
jgi:hypothetical protein